MVSKFRELAFGAGYLDGSGALPDVATLTALLGPPPPLPRLPSSIEPYEAAVEELVAQRVELMTIVDRLKERGYSHSYSSVRRVINRPYDLPAPAVEPDGVGRTINWNRLPKGS